MAMDVPKPALEVPPEGLRADDRVLHEALARETPEGWARRGMIGLVIVAGVFNVMAVPLMRLAGSHPFGGRVAMFFGPMLGGVLAGEIGAMACWLVWGEGRFWRRLAVHWGLSLVIVMCLTCGWLLATIDV